MLRSIVIFTIISTALGEESKEPKEDEIWKRKLLVNTVTSGDGGHFSIKSSLKSGGNKDLLRFRVQTGTANGLDLRAEVVKKGLIDTPDIDDRVKLRCSNLFAVDSLKTTVPATCAGLTSVGDAAACGATHWKNNNCTGVPDAVDEDACGTALFKATYDVYTVPSAPFNPETDSDRVQKDWDLTNTKFAFGQKDVDVPGLEPKEQYSVIKVETTVDQAGSPIDRSGGGAPLISIRTFATPVKMTVAEGASQGLKLRPTDLKFSMAFGARYLENNQYYVLKCDVQSRSKDVKTGRITVNTDAPTGGDGDFAKVSTVEEVVEFGGGTSFVAFETAASISPSGEDDDITTSDGGTRRERRSQAIEVPVGQQLASVVEEVDGEAAEDPADQVSDKTEFKRTMHFTFGATGQKIAEVDDSQTATVFWDPIVGAGTEYTGEPSVFSSAANFGASLVTVVVAVAAAVSAM
jgi:hypothetical protein